ncbi:MAG TPA: hypothetical protein VN914_14855, partial [Polyangia bacterium]|nr:hypothetical protein [Polyangia bacterium]
MRRLGLLVALALVGCGKDPTVVPVRNLERPSDMGFVCMRVVNGQLTGRPMIDCHKHLLTGEAKDSETVELNPRQLGTFGLVTNTARGELGVVDMDISRLVDLDPAQPGFNMLPVGAFPEVISASQDGCLVATANRGSCDLSVIDPQRLLAPTFGAKAASTGAGPLTTRVVPTTPSGRKLQVAPQEIAFLPQPVAALDKRYELAETGISPAALCQSSGAYDRTKPDQRLPWRAVVTFPSCDLVAVVELPSGTIVSSMYVRPNGVVDAGPEPVCPVDCGAGVVPQPGPDAAQPTPRLDAAPSPDASMSPDVAVPADAASDDAAASDASAVEAGPADLAPPVDAGPPDVSAPIDSGTPAPASSSTRIGALAVRPEGNRVYVGGGSDSFITAIDLAGGVLREAPGGGRIPLHDNPGGVRRLRLSLDPFALGGATNRDTGERERVGKYMGGPSELKQYLYAFAGDNSIR